MRYTLFLLVALLSYAPLAVAQPEVSLSEPFETPGNTGYDGHYQVLQLKNGHTFRFHFTDKVLEIGVYDKAHKQIAERTMPAEDIGWVRGLYEISGEPVIFFQRPEDKALALYRLRLNATDGSVTEKKKMLTIDNFRAAENMISNNEVMPGATTVYKDPASEAYAVITFQRYPKKGVPKLKVYHYSGDHSELSQAYYMEPADFTYVKHAGMVVDEKNVILATFGDNPKTSNANDSKMYISRLVAGDKDFSHQLMELPVNMTNTTGSMCFNPGTNKIQLLTHTLTNTKTKIFGGKATNYYLTLMTYIDPVSLDIIDSKPIEYKKIDAYNNAHFADMKPFVGAPQNMSINSDFTTTIVAEEQVTETAYLEHGHAQQSVALGNIAVLTLDNAGEELSGYCIRKSQFMHQHFKSFNLADNKNGVCNYPGWNTQFFSFDQFRTGNGKYVLFNEYKVNHENDNAPKTLVKDISLADAVGYYLGKAPDKFYVFGKPNSEREHTLINLQASHFLEHTSTYATIITEQIGEETIYRVAWLTFK